MPTKRLRASWKICRGICSRFSKRTIETYAELNAMATGEMPIRVQTVNLHHLYLASINAEFRTALLQADYITADGWPVRQLLSSRNTIVARRVTGSQFIEQLMSPASRKLRIALIGSSQDVGSRFEQMAEAAGHTVVLREHGSWRDWDAEGIADQLVSHQVQLTIVAVSPPGGELFANRLSMEPKRMGMIIGVGGSIDMVVGDRYIRRGGVAESFEWILRMIQEPRRLAGRYLINDLPFYAMVVFPVSMASSAGRRYGNARRDRTRTGGRHDA